ncbi:MAG: hypothetical protein Q4G08_11640, partial [Capnocytophaga sp.]|nr:hypothetical protein [Capnocytophaga sp.]
KEILAEQKETFDNLENRRNELLNEIYKRKAPKQGSETSENQDDDTDVIIAAEEELSAVREKKEGEATTPEQYDFSDIQPVGKGFFGNIYDQFKGKSKEAVAFLLQKKEGEAVGVFNRNDLGDIDLPYGNHGKKYGLEHIVEKHIKEQSDFDNVEQAVEVIDDVITNGEVTQEKWDKAIIEKDGYKVVISKNTRDKNGNVIESKNWIVTAFDKTRSRKEKTSSDVTQVTPNNDKGGRAVAPEEVSATNIQQNPETTPTDKAVEIIATKEKTNDPEQYDFSDIQPVGKGFFGNIYDQFKGKSKEAVAFLLQKKEGEAVGALSHKDVGDIDLVWGKEGTGKSDGFGLAKITKYHPEVMDNLQAIMDDMTVVSRTDNRIQMESETHQAAVRLEYDGEKKTWLLTAFEKESSLNSKTTDTTAAQNARKGGSLSNELSATNIQQNPETTPTDKAVEIIATKEKTNDPEQYDFSDIQPVGKGFFGNIYDQFKGKSKEAVAFLLQKKEGEAVGALQHSEIGDVDIVWGNEKAGLQKIAKKHPEILNNLQDRFSSAKIISKTENKIKLENEKDFFVVAPHYFGNEKRWLITAYEKKGNIASASSMNNETEPESKQIDTAPLQNNVSDTNVQQNPETAQEQQKETKTKETQRYKKEKSKLEKEWDNAIENYDPDSGQSPHEIDTEYKQKLQDLEALHTQKLTEIEAKKTAKAEANSTTKQGRQEVKTEAKKAKEEAAKKAEQKAKEKRKKAPQTKRQAETLLDEFSKDPAPEQDPDVYEHGGRAYTYAGEGNYTFLDSNGNERKLGKHQAEKIADLDRQRTEREKNAPQKQAAKKRQPTHRRLDKGVFNQLIGRLKKAFTKAFGNVKVTTNWNEFVQQHEALKRYGSFENMLFAKELQAVNKKFNEALQQLIDGTLPKGHIFQLGKPSAILKASGISDLPIELSADRLKRKSEQENHPFDLESVRDLSKAIQNPIAVFDSTKKDGSKVVLTELTDKNGNNFVVALKVSNKGAGRLEVEINDVKSVYPKDHVQGIIDWFNSPDSLLRFVNKEKAQDYISVQSTHLIGNGNKIEGLNEATKVVNDFENPTQNPEKEKTPDDLRISAPIAEAQSNQELDNSEQISKQQFNSAEATNLSDIATNVINNFKNPISDKEIGDVQYS